jgi:ABC-type nickel/cobalt efflux system permease component RcnA
MRVQRYISTLLLVCFSAYLVHSLVPHHHHSEVLHDSVTNCPFDHEDSHAHEHNADEHPTHCHAFNDVVFKKHMAPKFRPLAGSMQILFVTRQLKLPVEIQGHTLYKYVALKLPCRTANDLGSRDLRAPPVFA